MIWHAHIPLEPGDRESAGQHLTHVLNRVRRGGSLAKILGAKTCIEALEKINAWLLPLIKHAPAGQVGMLEGLRVWFLEHLMGEFALGVEQGVRYLRQLGTVQRRVAMWPKRRRRRTEG